MKTLKLLSLIFVAALFFNCEIVSNENFEQQQQQQQKVGPDEPDLPGDGRFIGTDESDLPGD